MAEKYFLLSEIEKDFDWLKSRGSEDIQFRELIERLENGVIPAADVAPVVHGRWEYDQNATDWGIGGYVCSVCKNRNNNPPCKRVKSVSFFSGAKYCPNCGARMDGGQG